MRGGSGWFYSHRVRERSGHSARVQTAGDKIIVMRQCSDMLRHNPTKKARWPDGCIPNIPKQFLCHINRGFEGRNQKVRTMQLALLYVDRSSQLTTAKDGFKCIGAATGI